MWEFAKQYPIPFTVIAVVAIWTVGDVIQNFFRIFYY